MIFLLPLVLSIVGALFFFITDAPLVLKLVVVVLVAAAAFVQFFVPAVPLVIPVLVQVALSIGFVIYWQIDQMR